MNEKIRVFRFAVNILQEAVNKLQEDEGFFPEAGNILQESKGFSKSSGNILQEDEGFLSEAGNKLKEDKSNLKELGEGMIFVETFSIAEWKNIKFLEIPVGNFLDWRLRNGKKDAQTKRAAMARFIDTLSTQLTVDKH